MVSLPNLTDVTVHIASPDDEHLAKKAAIAKDWRTYNRYRSAVVLHFGDKRVHIPTGKLVIDELRSVAAGKSPRKNRPGPSERKTVWQHLMDPDDSV